MSHRVHPVLQRKCRGRNRRRAQNNNGRVTEREHEADCHRPFALLHQLSGHIIDRCDMVRIYGMPKPKAVGKKGGAHQSGIVTKRNEGPHPRRQIESKQHGIDSPNLPARVASYVVEQCLNTALHASILSKTLKPANYIRCRSLGFRSMKVTMMAGTKKISEPITSGGFRYAVRIQAATHPSRWTPRVVLRRGSSMSCHARQGTRAGEHLQDEGVRARKLR